MGFPVVMYSCESWTIKKLSTEELMFWNCDAGKDWGQEEKEAREDTMIGWHHQLNDMSLSELQQIVQGKRDWLAAVHGASKNQNNLVTEQQQIARFKSLPHRLPAGWSWASYSLSGSLPSAW